ncbi:MAG: hypothetical protein RI957_1033 [Verrucomicrobiota bacterium]|jgi:hypothetical protein
MVVMAGILIARGNLDSLFGVPPTPIGERLYTGFTANEITEISLSSNDAKASFSRASGVWMMTSPVQDRMDPRWAKVLIDFTLSTRAADVIPNEKIDTTQAGLTDGMINVRLGDKNGVARARYVIGRRTAWMSTDPETKESVNTVFLQPRDKSRKSHIYACTGDIRSIFKDGFRYFRDHQPFLFAPSQLEKIHIKSAASEFLLEGQGNSKPWRITKPQKLATETSEVKKLIENGLFSLRALRVLDRNKVTLPITADGTYWEISLLCTGQSDPTTLKVFPPADDKATTVYATVSDRPNTVFELPLRPYPDLVSLSELPLKNYNELRSQHLTNFDHRKLQAIHFTPASGPEILLSRPPRSEWQLHLGDDQTTDLNEMTLYQFLKTMTEAKVADFLTDNAFLSEEEKDLETYGLKIPLLTLRFLFQNDSVMTLKIGRTKDGVITAHWNHPDTLHTIVKLPDDFLTKLPLRFRQWKDTRLLAIPSIDFVNLERSLLQQPVLKLQYNNRDDQWQAAIGEKDATAALNPARANKLLETLGDLRVNSWLNPDDAAALDALQQPSLQLRLVSRQLNEFGEQIGLKLRTLEITPVTREGPSSFFYGRLTGETDMFLLDRSTALMLAVDLFAESD